MVMDRTQIYLASEEVGLLERESRLTGASRSELIRRAIRAQYGKPEPTGRRAALERSAGSWAGRDFNGSEYTRAVRGSLEERLADLGMS